MKVATYRPTYVGIEETAGCDRRLNAHRTLFDMEEHPMPALQLRTARK